jgi:hypothetical protein
MNADVSLEDRIRQTLQAVADTVTEDALVQRRRPRRRTWAVVGAAVTVPVLLAAGAYVRSGPEYVDTIPPSTIVAEGEVGGDRYLLVESRRTECGKPVTGVELVEEDENLLGSEWNTIGSRYGEYLGDPPSECSFSTDRFLANPALYDDGGTTVGDSFVWLWAVHPDVTAVRITADGSSEDLEIYQVDGAGYALYEVPKGLETYTAELVIGDEVVPGSQEVQQVPDAG